MDIRLSPKQYLEEIGVVEFEKVAFFDPIGVVAPGFEASEAIPTESVGNVEEAALTPNKKSSVPERSSATEKLKGKACPEEEESCPSDEAKEMDRFFYRACNGFAELESRRSDFATMIITPYLRVCRGKQTKEEELALALQAPMHRAWKNKWLGKQAFL